MPIPHSTPYMHCGECDVYWKTKQGLVCWSCGTPGDFCALTSMVRHRHNGGPDDILTRGKS